MDRTAQIRQSLHRLVNTWEPAATMLARVLDVDQDALTCNLIDSDSGAEFYDVRVRPVIDGKECITILPKVSSWVLAVRIESSDDWMITGFGEADVIRWQVGEAVVEQDADGLLIKKQQDTLRQALELIVEAVQKIVVVQGQNPDYVKLQQAMTKIKNVLR